MIAAGLGEPSAVGSNFFMDQPQDHPQVALPIVTATIAEGQDALEAIWRLRYEVYIAEQAKPYGHADHKRRFLRDESDDFAGAHILVTAKGRPCATVRSLDLSDPRAYQAYEARFELDAFDAWPREGMVVCSRLAVLPEFRGGGAGRAAFEILYRHEARRGTLFSFHFCAPRLVPLFRRYGFREYLPPIEDAVISRAHRMVLLTDDAEHLQATGSPFLTFSKKDIGNSRTRSWFTERFPCSA